MASWTLMHMLLNVPEQRTTDWWWQAGLSNQNCFRVFSNYCKTIYILSAHYLVLGKLYEHSHLTNPKYMLPWQLCTPYKCTRCEPTASKQLMAWNPKDKGGKSQTWWSSNASFSLSPAAFTISFRLAQVTQDEWVRLTALRNISSPSSNSRTSQSITLPQSFKPCSNGRMTM